MRQKLPVGTRLDCFQGAPELFGCGARFGEQEVLGKRAGEVVHLLVADSVAAYSGGIKVAGPGGGRKCHSSRSRYKPVWLTPYSACSGVKPSNNN